MRIYTRSGDKGSTSLVYGKRVSKNDPRVESYGTCDEANSMIGFAVSLLQNAEWEGKNDFLKCLQTVQTLLFHVGSELSTPEGKKVHWKVEEEHIKEMEKQIDELDQKVPPLKSFILPGGHPAGAALHVARTIIRRAERRTVDLENINPNALAFLNRLSDYLFVAARYVNHSLGAEEKKLHK